MRSLSIPFRVAIPCALFLFTAAVPSLALAVQPLRIAQGAEATKTEANRWLKQGNEQYQAGQYEAAFQSWQQALTIYRQIQDPLGEGQALGNLGFAYYSFGNYAKAIEYQQQALVILRRINNRLGEGQMLGALGIAYLSLGDYAKALDYQQQRLVLVREIKDRTGEAQALGNLGNIYRYLGDFTKAIDHQQQFLAIARELKNRRDEGIALGNLANAYSILRDYAKAIDYQQQALAIAREVKNPLAEAAMLGSLGMSYFYLGNYTQAIDHHQQALAINRAIKNRLGEGEALGALGLAYQAQGNYAKAIDSQQQSLAIVRELKSRPGEGKTLNNLGYALRKAGRFAEAEKTLFEAVQVWESLRQDLGSNDANKVSIFETQAATYRLLQQVLIAQNKHDLALEVAERGRARAFVEVLAGRLAATPAQVAPLPPPKLKQIQQIAKAQNATLVEYSTIYDEFEVDGKQQTQPAELYIWVVQPTGTVTFRRTDLKPLWQLQHRSLSELVWDSREAIGVRGRGLSFREDPTVISKSQALRLNNDRLQQLHQLLIEPIQDLLPQKPEDRIIFVPQGALFFVPFAALQDKSGKYLIETHTMLMAPAIQVLELTRQSRQIKGEANKMPDASVLIVGNPTMPRLPEAPGQPPQPLVSLPGAETEAKAIAALLQAEAVTGNQATKAAILRQMTQARIIHLATHGLLDDFGGQGIPGAIALAPSQTDSGFLTASEIMNLKLKAELVVLSACDTGQGNITGDGVIGLSRSLISAGVPSVVVSLWKVPDEPTASLMIAFYQNLQQNPDKAQALRQAMLATMKEYPDPKAWAAFTLIGEAM